MSHAHHASGRVATLIGFVLLLLAALGATAATAVRADGTGLQPPAVTVLQSSPDSAPGFVFVTPRRTTAPSGQQGPEIVDGEGRPVWFDPLAGGDQATDFRVQRYRGKPVLTWWQGQNPVVRGVGVGVDEIADSSYHVIAKVRPGEGLDADQHEFVLTPRGTALITIYHAEPYDLSSIGGPADGRIFDGIVEEVDVATGRVLFEWHSLDHVPIADSYQPLPASAGTPWDYFHINSVNLDSDQNVLISSRHTWTIYKVDRHTGDVIWRLGGKESDFALGPGVRFAWQHDVHPAGPETLRVFDNESNGTPVLPHSRVIWIHLDTRTMTATLERSLEHPVGLSAFSQGNAQALDNGDTFVGWGAIGRASEFDAAGRLLFDALLPSGYDSYRAYRADWAGEPDTPPIATAQRNSDGSTTVHAMWNGATQVAQWRVLAGADADSLTEVATAPWSGLDTTITVNTPEAEFAVEALDRHGHVIGTSESVAA
jgi:hypothetical protein